MYIRLELTGTSPLLCHNIALADPENPFTREIASYTAKRKKTDDDRREVGRLEWFGGLYLDTAGGKPVMPAANIRKSIINAGTITRQGKQVERALSFDEMHVPIVHSGPADLNALHADPTFTDRAAVGISGKRVMRIRPKFPTWALIASAYLLPDVMDIDEFARVADRAGKAIGLGDNRVGGFGRFSINVIAL